ncbi:Cupredoxin [Corynespora cassiicola Philippines]|uniref:Cupredoxin n=1 Tax=Corynespora cassiicola Philippines TaxID=1448308 RepID=A0A2T2ND05_CORCC|nr:Cupredoxin [Corynespora cassiicola Philippines]
MISKVARVALGLAFITHVFAQDRYVSEVPEEEKAALAAIVEDDPDDIMTIMKDWVIYPSLRPARLVGYDGISPGPTIIVPRGTETVVRFMNNGDRENSVHLHGSPSRAPFDGWAEDLTFPGQMKDYYYPNNQAARFLWYHDHAMHFTAENAYFGQAGAYLITDPAEDSLGLPSGYGEYDIPLVLASKYYNEDGTLQSSLGEDQSLWGDVIHVNGQPWPYFNVEPRKYRLRFLNAAVSRNFALYFVNSANVNAKLPFQVIASDAGLFEHPVQVSDLIVSVAERYEIVFDFSAYAGKTLELRNLPKANGIGTDDDYANTDKVMRFVVGSTPVSDNSVVPQNLATVPFPPASNGIDHHFRFHRTNSEWRINGVGFADVQNRILAKVPRGKVEIWELENGSGGWTHPIHVHLVDFRILERYGDESTRGVMPYEAAGLKDVVWLGRHETVLVEAHYAPWNGVYMFHCHNLIHEDQDMMAAFDVAQLQNFGYNETTDFSDPEDPRWAARAYNRADFQNRSGPFAEQAINEAVTTIALQQPYSELAQVEDALEGAWSGPTPPTKQRRGEECDPSATEPIPRYRRFKI